MTSVTTLAFFGNLAGPDMLIIGLIALVIFGRRLPEVGKNLGKTIVEFKKGLNGATSGESEEEAAEEERPVTKRPQQRLTASSGGSTGVRAKSLPTTEEV